MGWQRWEHEHETRFVTQCSKISPVVWLVRKVFPEDFNPHCDRDLEDNNQKLPQSTLLVMMHQYLLSFQFNFIHFLIHFAKRGLPYLGKAPATTRTVLPSPASACWVFLWIHNPPKIRTWTTGSSTSIRDHSYACVYTWGLGTLTSQHNIFDTEKLFKSQVRHYHLSHLSWWCTIIMTPSFIVYSLVVQKIFSVSI